MFKCLVLFFVFFFEFTFLMEIKKNKEYVVMKFSPGYFHGKSIFDLINLDENEKLIMRNLVEFFKNERGDENYPLLEIYEFMITSKNIISIKEDARNSFRCFVFTDTNNKEINGISFLGNRIGYEIELLYISKKNRRNGFGTILMEHILYYVFKEKDDIFSIKLYPAYETEEFYEKFGFRKCIEDKNYFVINRDLYKDN
jgi:GNAT superfamily N-acetyltransferase